MERANSFDIERLEGLYARPEQKLSQTSTLKSTVNKVWQYLIDIFTKEPELRIWQRSDRKGNIWWDVYDPATGRSGTFGSETDMLSWIESRYYR